MDSRRDDEHAVVVHDPLGRVLSRNTRAAQLLGVRPGDLLPGHDTDAALDVRGADGAWRRLRPHIDELHWPDEATVLAVVRSYDEEALILLPGAELDPATRAEQAARAGHTPAAPQPTQY